MVRLSVNINKVALIRNSRGANFPDLIQVAKDCELFGAQGITVHPRPDERHAKFSDLAPLKAIVKTEFNIEGKPHARFMDEVLSIVPHQCTLVPDADNALTSDSGWDTVTYQAHLQDIISTLQAKGIRVSVFVNADARMVEGAKKAGADRVELYTGDYAHNFSKNPAEAIAAYCKAAEAAAACGIGLNAGHDLNLNNLRYFKTHIPNLDEVSIGHALIVDSLYYGLQNTIQLYLKELQD